MGDAAIFWLEVSVLVIVISAIAYWIRRQGIRPPLLLAVASLPLMQVPTVKLLARWRLSEIILGLMAIYLIGWRRRESLEALRGLPRVTTFALASLGLYVAYTGVVGAARAALTAPLAATWTVRNYFYHPILRTSLESGRMVATLTLLTAVLLTTSDRNDLRRLLGAFCAGGAVAIAYGWYQLVTFELPFSLMPGTYQQPNGRPGSTFFEPTGFASFAAVIVFVALGLAFLGRSRRWLWLLLAAVASVTMQMVASVAGALAGVAGSLLALVSSGGRILRNAALIVLLAAMSFIGLEVARSTYGPSYVRGAYSAFGLVRDVTERTRLANDPNMEGGSSSKSAGENANISDEAGVSGRPEGLYPRDIRDDVRPYATLSIIIGLGQGNALLFVGGTFGAVRLLLESGLLGFLFLAAFHGSVVLAAVRGLRRDRTWVHASIPFFVAAYGAASLVTLNYMNTTDGWLWFPAISILLLSRYLGDGKTTDPDCAR